ncbi:MAG: EAL domain-containing protein, partial [Pelovirga sp.]
TNDPAVAAVLGHQGIFEGEDYRGVHVVAAVLPVPDSPWFIVVKKDAVEIFAEWRFRALMISGLLATLVLSIGAVGILLWQRERRQYFERMYAAEALLRASVERHSVILKAIGDAVIATDTSGRVELLNQVAEQLTGWSETEARGRQLDEVFRIISEETLSPVESPVTKVLKEGLIVGLANHTLLIHRDGSERPIADSGAPIFDDQGQITGVVLVFRDQTEERRTVQQLRESATTFKKLSQVVEQNSAAVIITDINANIEYVNSKFTEITGYSAAEVIGKNPRILQSGEMDKSVHRQLWSHLLAGEQWQGEFLNKHRDGHLFWVRAQISPLRDDQGRTTHYIAVKEDITIQKRNEKQLEYQASYDALTGLANRTLLMDRLDQAIRYAQRSQRMVAVLLLDLDRFKVINDTLGHTAGDTVLCQIAERLKSAVRDTDTVARFGGDEFIVLLTEVCSEQDLDPIIQNILQVFKGPCQIEQRQLVLAASIGISIFPQNSSDPEHLIRYADIAMYQSKQSGSEFAFYSDEMDSFGLDTLDLEHDLHGALQRQEFCLHYQPKVDLQTGTISGCEALLRWQHPKLGMVSPGQFIPLAEQTNLIVPIGAWVLEEACRQSLAWQAAGLPPIRIAVNLSARQFRQGDLAATVNSILSESGLDPGLLELELTESMIMDDPQGAEQALVALKNLGVSLSLDDFGTGYSSLNYLSRFPVDHLKIDQSFIRDIGTSAARTAVVSSIIDIAHNLQLMAIAEGVETQDQLAFLVANKCDAMQGYLFSKPLPAGAFAQLLRQGICLNDIVSGPAVDK